MRNLDFFPLIVPSLCLFHLSDGPRQPSMFVRVKILALSHLALWGWHRPGTTAPRRDAGRWCCLFHLLWAECPLPALHKDHSLSAHFDPPGFLFPFHCQVSFASASPMGWHPIAIPWASMPTQRSQQGRYTGTLLWPPWAPGWHPLMDCHPWHGRNRGK